MKSFVHTLSVCSAFAILCHGFDLPTSEIADEKVTRLIENHMHDEITIIFDDVAGYDWVLQQNFSKTIINPGLDKRVSLGSNSSYVIITKNLESLKVSIQTLANLENWNNRKEYLVIYDEFVTEDDVKRSFELLFRYSIYNSAVYRSDAALYTWYPYDRPSECGKKINLIKMGNENPFADKLLRKVPGCHANVTWNPMSILVWDPFDATYPGAMVMFLDTLATRMDLSVTYLRNNTRFYPAYLDNSSYDELVRDMEERSIDMVIYFAYNGFSIQSLENSQRLHQSDQYFMLPSRKKYLNKNYIFNLYSPKMRLVVIAFIGASTVVWMVLSKRPLSVSIVDLIRISVQSGLDRIPTATPTRILLLSLLVFFMCLNVAYYTELSSILTKPSYEPKIRTIRRLLLETDIKIMSFDVTLKHAMLDKKYVEVIRRKLIPMRLHAEASFGTFLRMDSFALPYIEFQINYFRNPEKLEIIYGEPLNAALYFIAMKKGHPLMEVIDFWIETMKEAGLMEEYIRYTCRNLTKFTVEDAFRLEKVKLGLVHVEGAFAILVIGNLVSSVVFLVEILYHRNHANVYTK